LARRTKKTTSGSDAATGSTPPDAAGGEERATEQEAQATAATEQETPGETRHEGAPERATGPMSDDDVEEAVVLSEDAPDEAAAGSLEDRPAGVADDGRTPSEPEAEDAPDVPADPSMTTSDGRGVMRASPDAADEPAAPSGSEPDDAETPEARGTGLRDGGADPSADPAGFTDAPGADVVDTPPRDVPPPAGDRAMVAPPPPRIIEERGPGFVPLVLGGVVAAALGYALSFFTGAGGGEDRIAALESEVAALSAAPQADLAEAEAARVALTDRLDALEMELRAGAADEASDAGAASTAGLEGDTRVDALRDDLAALEARVEALPDTSLLAGRINRIDSAVTALGTAPLEAELETVREELSAVREAVGARLSEMDETVAQRLAALEAGLSELQARSEAGLDDAARVARAAAKERLALAVEGGLPFEEALDDLDDVPDILRASAGTGVPTEAELAEDLPPLAREALRAARAAEPGPPGLGSLAGRFLNARSLEPREGDDPDAVLSRVEAAARAGDIAAALAEIEALPEVAREPLADWIDRAEAHRAAQAALQDYLQDA
jgi:hypothetical protein